MRPVVYASWERNHFTFICGAFNAKSSEQVVCGAGGARDEDGQCARAARLCVTCFCAEEPGAV